MQHIINVIEALRKFIQNCCEKPAVYVISRPTQHSAPSCYQPYEVPDFPTTYMYEDLAIGR